MESGWSANQQGYVHYAFALRNTSTTQQVQYPQITITGRAKDGSIVFSQTQTLNMAFPNQTVYDAGQAGEGTAPATVDFVVLSPVRTTSPRLKEPLPSPSAEHPK